MAGELLKKDTGIDIVHIPYKGGAPALVDGISGQVNTYFANAASSLGYITGGQLKALAVTSPQRMSELPNVPTVAESGIKGFRRGMEWLLVSARTPADVVEWLHAAVQAVLARDDGRTQLGKLGLRSRGQLRPSSSPISSTPRSSAGPQSSRPTTSRRTDVTDGA